MESIPETMETILYAQPSLRPSLCALWTAARRPVVLPLVIDLPHHQQHFPNLLIKVCYGQSTSGCGTYYRVGKKQLGQLMGLLDKGTAVKDSLGGRENQALRAVRAKRDADEAGVS